MEGFLSRLFGLILTFFMLIIAPLINAYGTQEMENRINLLNDTTEFIDKQTDKGIITDQDMDQFYADIESHGMILDVTVNRLVRVDTQLKDGSIHTTYIAADEEDKDSSGKRAYVYRLNQRDVLQVKLREKSSTPYKRLLNAFLRIDDNAYELDMAKMVK